MKNDQTPSNHRINSHAITNRYKVRQFKTSRLNLNVKPILSDDQYSLGLNQNYSPFTINSRHLTEYRKETLFAKIKPNSYKSQKSQKKVPSQEIKSSNKTHTKMPSISQTSKKFEMINENQLILLKGSSEQKRVIHQRPYHSQSKVKRCSCGKCQECMKDFAYYLHICSDQKGLPQITAKSWCIWRQKDQKFSYYYGKRIHKVRQIASLTKIITAMVLIDYSNKFNFQLHLTKFAIRKSSSLIGGTTAKLNVGEVYTLKELLYGMMLPSGNDAAIAISQAVSLMINLKNKSKKFDPHSDDWFQQYQLKNYAYLFISAMNQKVQRLGTIDTKFYNSHGNDAYDQLKNISTCNQVAKISSEFMKYPLLKEIVKTVEFTFSNGQKIQNTNKLLDDGFEGIKTGITETAGPCLAACYKDFIVVVLNSKSINQRWFEVKKLVKWIKNRF